MSVLLRLLFKHPVAVQVAQILNDLISSYAPALEAVGKDEALSVLVLATAKVRVGK